MGNSAAKTAAAERTARAQVERAMVLRSGAERSAWAIGYPTYEEQRRTEGPQGDGGLPVAQFLADVLNDDTVRIKARRKNRAMQRKVVAAKRAVRRRRKVAPAGATDDDDGAIAAAVAAEIAMPLVRGISLNGSPSARSRSASPSVSSRSPKARRVLSSTSATTPKAPLLEKTKTTKVQKTLAKTVKPIATPET